MREAKKTKELRKEERARLGGISLVRPLFYLLFSLSSLGSCVITRLPKPEVTLSAQEAQYAADSAQATEDDLAPLSDEFTSQDSLKNWKKFYEVEGWLDQMKKMEIQESEAGVLYMEPYTSYWLYDFHAPFLFKEVTGDFVVTTRLKVSGASSEVPKQTYSLAGLMAREPHPEGSKGWKPNRENWMFITTGSADGDIPQIEAKNTVNGKSRLQLTPGKTGWVELRMVRTGNTFLVLRRFEGEAWTAIRREAKPEMPSTVQVGLIAYTDYESSDGYFLLGRERAYHKQVFKNDTPDMIARFDWVHFQRPSK